MNQALRFPLPVDFVRNLLFLSEGVPAFNDASRPASDRARGHAIDKHLQPDPDQFRVKVHQDQQAVSAFRDFTEMCHAGEVVLNSAWGRFAITRVLGRGEGARVIFETEMPRTYARVGKPGEVGLELMSLARTVLESPPSHFGFPLKVHTFFPVSAYKRGRAWCEIEGFATYFSVDAT